MAQSGKAFGKMFQNFGGYAGIIVALLCMIFLCVASASAQSKLSFNKTDTLEELREKIKKNGYNFTVGHTWVYDLPAEQKAKMFKPRTAPPRDMRIMAPHSDVVLDPKKRAAASAAKFDWRSYGGHSYVGPVHDQGYLGSCYAFGAAAAAETTYNVSQGLYDASCVDFAEMYIIWTLSSVAPYSDHFYGDDGADMDYYELYGLTRSGPPEGAVGFEGIIDEANFPYSDSATPPGAATINNSKTYPRVLFKEWKRVFPASYADTTAQMKTAIATYGAIDVAIQTDSAFDAYTGGIYENTNTEPDETPYYYTTTDHSVSLVGWDDDPDGDGDTSDGCWILRNSYGAAGWGENGYMRIKYFSAAVNTSAAYLVAETAPASTTSTISTTTSVPGDGPCAATQVLGADNPELENLRAFRDSTLAQSPVGRKILRIYYNNAGSINAAFERSPALRAAARRVLAVLAPMAGRKE